jgi:hypothetical protein
MKDHTTANACIITGEEKNKSGTNNTFLTWDFRRSSSDILFVAKLCDPLRNLHYALGRMAKSATSK